MNEIYSIPDWDATFETAASRKLKRLTWIAMNVLFDTDQYAELTSHPHGAAHLGCWTALIMAAAKGAKRDGTLLRANGMPHTAESLALITRLPVESIREALPRLVEIGLLRVSATTLADSATTSADSATTSADSATTSADSATTSADAGKKVVLQDITLPDKQTKQNPTRHNPTSPNTTSVGVGVSSAIASATDDSLSLEVLEQLWRDAPDNERVIRREAYRARARELKSVA